MRTVSRGFRPIIVGLRLLALAVVALGLTVPAASPSRAAGLGDVLRQAVSSSPTIRSAVARLEAEEARLVQAEAERGFSVRLNSRFQGVHIRDSGASTEKLTGSVFIEASRNIYDDGRVLARISEAEARVRAAAARVRLAEQQLLLAAVDAYIRLLEGERLLALAMASRRTLESELSAAKNRFELGSGTRTAVAQAESRLAEAETGYARRAGELEIARSRFETAIGAPPPADLPQLTGLPELPRTLPGAITLANDEHPELRALRADVEALEHARRRIGAMQAGDGLSIVGSAGATHDSARTGPPGPSRMRPEFSAGIVFSVPLYDGGAKSARILESQLLVDARRADLIGSEGAVREETVSAWESRILAESTIDSGKTRTDAATIALEGVRRAAQGGQATTLDILDAERELLDAETGLVQAEFARLVAAYRLRAAVGSLTLEALGL